jgi:predicted PurR-regulated permease PerM
MTQRLWVLGFILVLGTLVYSLKMILVPFLAGFIGAYAFNRPVCWLEKKGISRDLATFFIIVSLLVTMALLMMIALPYLHKQLVLLALNMPHIVDNLFSKVPSFLTPFLNHSVAHDFQMMQAKLSSNLDQVLTWTLQLLTNLVYNSMALANVLSLVFLTPFLMFYLLKDWPLVIHHLQELIPLSYRPTAHDVIRRVDTILGEYVKAQALICLTLMVLYALALRAAGLEQGIFIGIMTGFLSFIPYVGALIGFAATLGLSFAQLKMWSSIGLICLAFLSVSLFEGYILTPRIMGRRIGLSPVWVIFSLLACGTWFGFFGVVLALPIAAVMRAISGPLKTWYIRTAFYRSPAQGELT